MAFLDVVAFGKLSMKEKMDEMPQLLKLLQEGELPTDSGSLLVTLVSDAASPNPKVAESALEVLLISIECLMRSVPFSKDKTTASAYRISGRS
jgi:hypothetical protein